LAAELRKRNAFLQCGESEYKLLILKGGRVLSDDDNIVTSFGDSGENEDEYKLAETIRDDIYKLSQTLITLEKERLKNKEDIKYKLELDRKRKEEKALFNQLQKNMDETITITKKEYDSLIEDSETLSALESAGVDNWSGYDYAMEILKYKE
jgi:hypothetical protein